MRSLLFWEFPRASWQYDIVVVLILAFIFFTPREIFRDYPRAAQVVQVPTENGAQVFWIEPTLLPSESSLHKQTAEKLIRSRTGKAIQVHRVEPMTNAEQDVMGYMAYARP